MNSHGDTGDRFGAHFGDPDAVCLRCTPLGSAAFSTTRISRPLNAGEDFSVVIPPQQSYFLMLHLSDTIICDVSADGKRSRPKRLRRGSICLVGLHDGMNINVNASLDGVAFVIPYLLLDEIVALSSPGRRAELRCLRGKSDPVLANLSKALLPMFLQNKQQVDVLLQHLAMAICAHLLHHYSQPPPSVAGGDNPPALH